MDIIARTGDVALITDGERRYGLLLFEVCQELFRSGRPGRPRKVLRRGVRVRLKNKGSQSHRRRRKRPKYEAPCPEHPATPQDVSNAEIHAHHVEALNAALRRKNSAYRRKTNTYAKKKTGLQRTSSCKFSSDKLGWSLPVVGSDGVNATSCGCRTKASLENLQEQRL